MEEYFEGSTGAFKRIHLAAGAGIGVSSGYEKQEKFLKALTLREIQSAKVNAHLIFAVEANDGRGANDRWYCPGQFQGGQVPA